MRPALSKPGQVLVIAIFACMLAVSSCKKDNNVPVTPFPPPVPPPDTTLKINSLSETTLHYGDTITINGNNFSATAANNLVTINDVAANVQSATTAQLKVIVPAVGNTSGELKIKTGSKTASGGNVTYVPDVFVAGYQNSPAHALATYWKNGTAVTLSQEESALASIFVSDNDVYVAGYERISNLQLANYWKNGAKTTLGTFESSANTIFVNGNDVHVGGWEINNGFDNARYWKNGTGTWMDYGNSTCTGIYVKGNNTYLVGSRRNSQGRFEPWESENGATPAITIPNNDKHCYANAAFENGSDKYVAGTQNNPTTGLPMATCWKNGSAANLTDGSASMAVAVAVFVSGNDVYVAGWDQEDYYGAGPSFAKYWKNGVPVKLSTVSSGATGIVVFGNDVYVSGWENNGSYNVARYWKNGVRVDIGNAVLHSSGNAIVVR